MQKLQDTLNGLESESQRMGETHNSDRFALEIELARLKNDLFRHEEELESAREELARRDALLRERDMTVATLVRLTLLSLLPPHS